VSSVIRLAPASSETPSPDQNSILADYVDRLVAPLVGLVPYERRERFRSEVLSHLEALTEDHISTGLSADEAANKAVREHGAPRPISEKFLETWFEKGARGPLSQLRGVQRVRFLGGHLSGVPSVPGFHSVRRVLSLAAEPGTDSGDLADAIAIS